MIVQDVLLRVLPLVDPGRVFADAEWQTLTAMADTMLEGCPVAITPPEVADNVERFLAVGRSKRAWRIRFLLHLIEWTPIPLFGRPFTELNKDERKKLIVEKYQPGRRIWGICAKIRFLVYVGIYGDSRAHAVAGYEPASARVRLRRSKNGVERQVVGS